MAAKPFDPDTCIIRHITKHWLSWGPSSLKFNNIRRIQGLQREGANDPEQDASLIFSGQNFPKNEEKKDLFRGACTDLYFDSHRYQILKNSKQFLVFFVQWAQILSCFSFRRLIHK